MTTPTVASLIRERMEARDLTQAELGELTRLHRMTIHYLVNGKTRITKNTAPRLAKALGETALWWLNAQAAVDAKEAK